MTPVDPVPPAQPADEELVPHPFNSRTRYEPGDDRDIWCKDCEYHRDHEIHRAEAAGVPPAARPPLRQDVRDALARCFGDTTYDKCTWDRVKGAFDDTWPEAPARPQPADPDAKRLREWAQTSDRYGDILRAAAGIVSLGIAPIDMDCLTDDEDKAIRALLDAIRRGFPLEYEADPTLEAAVVRPHLDLQKLARRIVEALCGEYREIPMNLSRESAEDVILGVLAAAQASGLVSEPSDEPPPKIRRQTFLGRQYSVALAQVNRQAEKYAGLVSELRALHDSYWNRLAPEDRARPDYTETKFCRQLAALLADLAVRPQTEHQDTRVDGVPSGRPAARDE